MHIVYPEESYLIIAFTDRNLNIIPFDSASQPPKHPLSQKLRPESLSKKHTITCSVVKYRLSWPICERWQCHVVLRWLKVVNFWPSAIDNTGHKHTLIEDGSFAHKRKRALNRIYMGVRKAGRFTTNIHKTVMAALCFRQKP
jgi:hypothetical protein